MWLRTAKIRTFDLLEDTIREAVEWITATDAKNLVLPLRVPHALIWKPL